MATKKAPAGEPSLIECDECRTPRRNLVAHLTPRGELLKLCPACFGKRCLA